jgi:hypothetical protein
VPLPEPLLPSTIKALGLACLTILG